MKNIFQLFGTQKADSTDKQPNSFELNEQDLEQVSGAHGRGHHDDDCQDDSGGDWDCNHDDDWNYRHHRRKPHHDC